eukprot:11983257-Heterocapsa_arctica.AAC.1
MSASAARPLVSTSFHSLLATAGAEFDAAQTLCRSLAAENQRLRRSLARAAQSGFIEESAAGAAPEEEEPKKLSVE